MSKKQQEQAGKHMTSAEVCTMIGVTPMTLYLYRTGKIKGKSKIPFQTKPKGTERHSVIFLRSQVLKWVKKNNIEITE